MGKRRMGRPRTQRLTVATPIPHVGNAPNASRSTRPTLHALRRYPERLIVNQTTTLPATTPPSVDATQTNNAPPYTPISLPVWDLATRDLGAAEYGDATRAAVLHLVSNALHENGIVIGEWLDGDSSFDWSTGGARLARRVARAVHKVTGVVLDADLLQRIGQLAAAERNLIVTCDVTDRFDWVDGDFADTDSCFWRGWVNARAISLPKLGARALRFYADRDKAVGNGRCWILPLPLDSKGRQEFVTFNYTGAAADIERTKAVTLAYLRDALGGQWYAHNLPRLDISNLFVSLFSPVLYSQKAKRTARWKGIVLDNSWENRSTLPIPDWAHDAISQPQFVCTVCYDPIGKGDMHIVNGARYCNYCYGEVFDQCTLCGADMHHASAVEAWITPDYIRLVCPTCAKTHVKTCPICDTTFVASLPTNSKAHRHYSVGPFTRRSVDGNEQVLCWTCSQRH